MNSFSKNQCKIIACIQCGVRNPSEIATKAKVSRSCVSRELKHFRKKRWVDCRRSGVFKNYFFTSAGKRLGEFLFEFHEGYQKMLNDFTDPQ